MFHLYAYGLLTSNLFSVILFCILLVLKFVLTRGGCINQNNKKLGERIEIELEFTNDSIENDPKLEEGIVDTKPLLQDESIYKKTIF